MRQTYQFILLLLTGVFFYSCQGDELSTQGNEGYLRVTLEQSAEVNTKADYKSKQMRVVIKNSAGVTKFETNDHTADLEGKELSLKQGEYTIEAVSNGWDGNAGPDGCLYGCFSCRKDELQGAKNLGGQRERSLYIEL